MTVSAQDEFAHVPTPRTRHPALAIGAALLAFFLVFHIRQDLLYCLSSSTPVDLGDARTLFLTKTALPGATNQFVHLRGMPDRQNALELDTRGSWTFSQLLRIMQTDGRLFLHRRESPLPAFRAEQDVFEGRLIRFADLSFEDSIRRYYAGHVSATHFFRPVDLVAALQGSVVGSRELVALRDRAGDEIKLGPADLLAIDVSRPGELRVAMPRDKFGSEGAGRAAIEQQGGAVIGPAPPLATDAPPTHHAFLVKFPAERREAGLGALGDLDPRIEIREARDVHHVRLADLGAEGRDVLIVRDAQNQPLRIPLASIPSVRTLAAVQIPEDAYLLIEGDLPREHWHTLLASALLILFGAVNLLGLRRGLR